jgi:hypothetical protein
MNPTERQSKAPTVTRSGPHWGRRTILLLPFACVGTIAIAAELQTLQVQRESPSVMGNGYSFRRDREYQHIECQLWRDTNQRFYYGICIGYVSCDPSLPVRLPTYEFKHPGKDGELLIDGKKIERSQARRLLVLDPFGKMVEIPLSPEEEQMLKSARDNKRYEEVLWEEIVLKRLYRREGRVEDGKLAGHWIYSDSDGKKAYEGTYVRGRRDGTWTYYRENGKLRAQMSYRNGDLQGECKYFDAKGELTDTISWDNDDPVDRTVKQTGLGHSEVRGPGHRSESISRSEGLNRVGSQGTD